MSSQFDYNNHTTIVSFNRAFIMKTYTYRRQNVHKKHVIMLTVALSICSNSNNSLYLQAPCINSCLAQFTCWERLPFFGGTRIVIIFAKRLVVPGDSWFYACASMCVYACIFGNSISHLANYYQRPQAVRANKHLHDIVGFDDSCPSPFFYSLVLVLTFAKDASP